MASTSSFARTQRGGTLFGAIGGLLIGLVVAVLVAIYVTRAPVPFVNRGLGKAPDPTVIDPSKAPDPNRGMYSGRDAPAGTAPTVTPGTPATEGVGTPAPIPGAPAPTTPTPIPVPGTGVSPPVIPGFNSPATPAPTPVAPPTAPADDGSTYYLQVGAFRGVEEAETFKARLALMGFEAFVASAQVNQNTLYRVRLGPFRRLDDMNRARARLAESKIEASVIKTRQ
nr:SPOR domain-containing protein [Pigmentiphaga aceris]